MKEEFQATWKLFCCKGLLNSDVSIGIKASLQRLKITIAISLGPAAKSFKSVFNIPYMVGANSSIDNFIQAGSFHECRPI